MSGGSMATADLHCMVCPSRPAFSDQSHLLTHMSSKGHLAHFFKAQVLAIKDVSVQESLQAYDDWYRRNEIGKLLAQRLDAKEKRLKIVGDTAKERSKTFTFGRLDMEDTPCPEPIPMGLTYSLGSCIDPNLEEAGTTCQDAFVESYCSNSASQDGQKRSWGAPIAKMYAHDQEVVRDTHYLDITPQEKHEATQGFLDLRYAGRPAHMNELYSRNKQPRTNFHYTGPTAIPRSATSVPHPASNISHSRQGSSASSTFETDVVSEFHRLKGMIWPGMDLFDTASEESKRRRNQKKDRAALVQLAADSEAITPTEVIYFYPSWEVKKSRFISGNVESSPIRENTPVPKRAPKAGRRALAELDPNVPAKERKEHGNKVNRNKAKVKKPRKPKREFPATGEEIIDLMQPFEPIAGTRKRAFHVFEDGSPRPSKGSLRRDELCGPQQEFTYFDGQNPITDIATSGIGFASSTQNNLTNSSTLAAGLLYHTPQQVNKLPSPRPFYVPPPIHFRPSPKEHNADLPQSITPQRLFLHSPPKYGPNLSDFDFGTGLLLPSPYGKFSDLSPLGFNLSAMLACHDEKTPARSAARVNHSRTSPSERAVMKKQHSIAHEDKPQATIDFIHGVDHGSHFI